MSDDPLHTTLLDLLHELEGTGVPLILGGGYGLYLKQLRLQELGSRTVIDGSLWPYPRSTEDLDLFLQTDVLGNLSHMQLIRQALDALNFTVIEEVKFMHFEKSVAPTGRVKIDLLTGPITDPQVLKRLHVKRPRVRPKGSIELHAYLTDEAVAFEDSPFEVPLSGHLSSGQPYTSRVLVPQPFTFMLMKLHAFRDRKTDANKKLGQHHALDLYRVCAMMTEDEDAIVRSLLHRYRLAEPVTEARRIVAADFKNNESLGVLRLREHDLSRPEMDLDRFLSVLHDCFPNI